MDEDFEAELYEEALLQAQDFTPDRPGPPHDYPPPAVPPGYDSWEDFMEAARRNLEYVALVHGPGGVNEMAEAYRRMHPDPTGERRSHPGVHYEVTEDHTYLDPQSPEYARLMNRAKAAQAWAAEVAWSNWADKQMRSEDA